jgi:hypothetical protein
MPSFRRCAAINTTSPRKTLYIKGRAEEFKGSKSHEEVRAFERA